MSLPISANSKPAGGSGLVVIGASTGGVRALCTLFENMPPLNASVLLVQHLPRFIEPSFLQTLRRHTRMTVELAQDGALLKPGTISLAPAEVHCTLDRNSRIRLRPGPPVNYVCPSIDVAMKSLSSPPEDSPLVGILLTGMGRDGADGMVHMKRLGGYTLAQDEASCAVFGMPKEAWNAGGADALLPPERIARRLLLWVGRLPGSAAAGK